MKILACKITVFLICFTGIFSANSAYGQANRVVSLDEAIQNSARQIENRLDAGSTVIVFQFQSQNEMLSDYVLKELFDLLVNANKFVVLDRTANDVINAELEFQFTTSAGMISDNSLASLSKRIGAQAIITGSLDYAANEYRFRIRVIGTETAAAMVSYAASVDKKDRLISALSGRQATAGEKMGTGALNILFGLGSYLEDDISGGITLTAGYAVAAGLMIIEATALDWHSPIVGLPATLGASVAGVTLVYGFFRPFIYNRASRLVHVIDNTQFVITPASFQMSWSYKF